jgi:hypothetical protein
LTCIRAVVVEGWWVTALHAFTFITYITPFYTHYTCITCNYIHYMHYIQLHLLHTLHTITHHYTRCMLQLYSCSCTAYCCSYTPYFQAVTCNYIHYIHYITLHTLHALHTVTCITRHYMIYTLLHGRLSQLWPSTNESTSSCHGPAPHPGHPLSLLSSWQGGSAQTFRMTRGIDC